MECEELKAIHDAFIIKLDRRCVAICKNNTTDAAIDAHVSEASIDLIEPDVEMINDGTLDGLRRSVDDMMLTQFHSRS
jgi:hypothetical protein